MWPQISKIFRVPSMMPARGKIDPGLLTIIIEGSVVIGEVKLIEEE